MRVRAFSRAAAAAGLALALLAPSVLPERAAASDKPPGRLKVLGLTLLVPGLGHRAMGQGGRGGVFMAADAGIWSAFGVFRVQGHLRKDSYIEMAELYAGVPEASDRSDDYYQLLGSYRSSEEYDDEIRRDARARVGDDLQAREDYFQRHRMPADRVWEWSSNAAWDRYQDKRSESERAYKKAGYMVGVAIANRLLASVDAMRLHGKASRGAGSPYLSIIADPVDPREPARLCVTVPLP